MGIPYTLSNVIIKCSIIGHVASWSVPDQNNQPYSQKQNTPNYNWEQSWKTENNNQVTTVTTSTSGIIPPGTGFENLGAASIWTYHYSYSDNFSDTGSTFEPSDDDYIPASKTSLSGSAGVIPSNRSAANYTPASNSYSKSADASKTPPVVLTSPKPAPKAQSTPIQTQNTKPGSASNTPGYTNNKQPGYTNTNPRYNSSAISTTGGRLGRLSNTSALSAPAEHIRGSQMQAWLDHHNNYRSQYGVGSVTWSEELVPTARRQVEKCIWKHTQKNRYGENIAAGQNSASDVVVAWVEGPNEREIWNPQSATPTHFTQVVWKATKQIGCASKTCQTIEGSNLPQSPVILSACEYHPKGNVQGEYVKNVLAAAGGKPLASAATSASVSVDPDNPDAANAGSVSVTKFL